MQVAEQPLAGVQASDFRGLRFLDFEYEVRCVYAVCVAQVSAWEKGNLAKPGMTFESDPLDQRFTQHIYSSKENSSGGYGVGGGGCGCN